MRTNLSPAYVEFVQSDGNLGYKMQEIIDRMQYSPGFLGELEALLKKFESPFEVIIDMQEGIPQQVRRLKLQYREKISEPPSGNN